MESANLLQKPPRHNIVLIMPQRTLKVPLRVPEVIFLERQPVVWVRVERLGVGGRD